MEGKYGTHFTFPTPINTAIDGLSGENKLRYEIRADTKFQTLLFLRLTINT